MDFTKSVGLTGDITDPDFATVVDLLHEKGYRVSSNPVEGGVITATIQGYVYEGLDEIKSAIEGRS